MMNEVIQLLKDSRYLAARDVYNKLSEEEKFFAIANPIHNAIVDMMLERVGEIDRAIEIGKIDDTWTLGLTYFGITTHYRVESDGFLTLRLEGILEDMPIFEQAAVIHELGLFKNWMPFCSESKMIRKTGPAEMIGYINIFIPPLNRETLMLGWACDALMEDNKIIICGNSIPTWPPEKPIPTVLPDYNDENDMDNDRNIPWKGRGWFSDLLDVKEFKIVSQLCSPKKAKVR
jgi:hypothetical protein